MSDKSVRGALRCTQNRRPSSEPNDRNIIIRDECTLHKFAFHCEPWPSICAAEAEHSSRIMKNNLLRDVCAGTLWRALHLRCCNNVGFLCKSRTQNAVVCLAVCAFIIAFYVHLSFCSLRYRDSTFSYARARRGNHVVCSLLCNARRLNTAIKNMIKDVREEGDVCEIHRWMRCDSV